jgi:hypothetical protein
MNEQPSSVLFPDSSSHMDKASKQIGFAEIEFETLVKKFVEKD